jgi:hypothetical protein
MGAHIEKAKNNLVRRAAEALPEDAAHAL